MTPARSTPSEDADTEHLGQDVARTGATAMPFTKTRGYVNRVEFHGVTDEGKSPTELIHALCDKLDAYHKAGDVVLPGSEASFTARCAALGLTYNPASGAASVAYQALERLEAQAATPEKTHFQILYSGYGTEPGKLPDMQRHGLPSKELELQTRAAVDLMRRHDVQEVFICTVHSAFVKDVNIKKAI